MLRRTTSVRYAFQAFSSFVVGAVIGAASATFSSSFLQAPRVKGSSRQAVISRRIMFMVRFSPSSKFVIASGLVALPLRLQRGGYRRRDKSRDIASEAGDLAYQR